MCLSDDRNSRDWRERKAFPASDGGRSTINRILLSLQDTYRRYLLYCLQEEEPCTLDEAARRVAAWDYGCNPADVPSKTHDRIKAELYHIHLPKLADLNVIDYDERSGVIRLRDPPDNLADFLALARTEDDVD